MTMVAKVAGAWIDVPADDEKVLDRYSEAVPMVWAPPYFGAGPEMSWVPLYDEDGRGSFEEQLPGPERGSLEQLAADMVAELKQKRREQRMPNLSGLDELVKTAVRAHLKDEYVFTGALHRWFSDDCGHDCQALAEKDTRKAAEKLRKAITRITAEVIAEMATASVEDRLKVTA